MTYVWCRVDKTEQPLIAARVTFGANVELGGEEEVGTVDDGLIHLQAQQMNKRYTSGRRKHLHPGQPPPWNT